MRNKMRITIKKLTIKISIKNKCNNYYYKYDSMFQQGCKGDMCSGIQVKITVDQNIDCEMRQEAVGN